MHSVDSPALILTLLLAGAGCTSPAGDGGDDNLDHSDVDGDGLEAWEEEELGTDPDDADSDADGFSDGDEVAENTDPLDPSDLPYAGGWSIAACRDSIVATGDLEGEIVNDWSLPDQFGQQVRLHSFCDRAVLLVAAAFW